MAEQTIYKPRKVFTLEEANRTLPLVTRVIRDIVAEHQTLSDLNAKAREADEQGRQSVVEGIRDTMHDHLHQLEDYVEELQQVGCEFKDPREGLVDFPARIPKGNRLVFLCWKLGESEIRFWHAINSGFAGRKPVEGFFR